MSHVYEHTTDPYSIQNGTSRGGGGKKHTPDTKKSTEQIEREKKEFDESIQEFNNIVGDIGMRIAIISNFNKQIWDIVEKHYTAANNNISNDSVEQNKNKILSIFDTFTRNKDAIMTSIVTCNTTYVDMSSNLDKTVETDVKRFNNANKRFVGAKNSFIEIVKNTGRNYRFNHKDGNNCELKNKVDTIFDNVSNDFKGLLVGNNTLEYLQADPKEYTNYLDKLKNKLIEFVRTNITNGTLHNNNITQPTETKKPDHNITSNTTNYIIDPPQYEYTPQILVQSINIEDRTDTDKSNISDDITINELTADDIADIFLCFVEMIYLLKLENAAGDDVDTDIKSETNLWMIISILYLHVFPKYDKFSKPIPGTTPDVIADADILNLITLPQTKTKTEKTAAIWKCLFYIYTYRQKIISTQDLYDACKPIFEHIGYVGYVGEDPKKLVSCIQTHVKDIRTQFSKQMYNEFIKTVDGLEYNVDYTIYDRIITHMSNIDVVQTLEIKIKKAKHRNENTNGILAIIRTANPTQLLYKYKDNRKFTRITEQARCCATEYTDDEIHITTNDIVIYRKPEAIAPCQLAEPVEIIKFLDTNSPVFNYFRLFIVLLGYIKPEEYTYTHCRFLNKLEELYDTNPANFGPNYIIYPYLIKSIQKYMLAIANRISQTILKDSDAKYSQGYSDTDTDYKKYIAKKYLTDPYTILHVLYDMRIYKKIYNCSSMLEIPEWAIPKDTILTNDPYTTNKLKTTVANILNDHPEILLKIHEHIAAAVKTLTCNDSSAETIAMRTNANQFDKKMKNNETYRNMVKALKRGAAHQNKTPAHERNLHRLLYEYTKSILRDKINNPEDNILNIKLTPVKYNVYSTTVGWVDKQLLHIDTLLRHLYKLYHWPIISLKRLETLREKWDEYSVVYDPIYTPANMGEQQHYARYNIRKNWRENAPEECEDIANDLYDVYVSVTQKISQLYTAVKTAHTSIHTVINPRLIHQNTELVELYKLMYKQDNKCRKLELAKQRDTLLLNKLEKLNDIKDPDIRTKALTSFKNHMEDHWVFGRMYGDGETYVDTGIYKRILARITTMGDISKDNVDDLITLIKNDINAINDEVSAQHSAYTSTDAAIYSILEHHITVKSVRNNITTLRNTLYNMEKTLNDNRDNMLRKIKSDKIATINYLRDGSDTTNKHPFTVDDTLQNNTTNMPNECVQQIVNTPIANCMCVIPDAELIGAVFPKAYIQKLNISTDITHTIHKASLTEYKQMVTDIKQIIIKANTGIVGYLQFPYNTVTILTVEHTIHNTKLRSNSPSGISRTTHKYIATSHRDKPGFKICSTPQKEVPSFSKLLHAALAPMRIGESAKSYSTLTSTWQSVTLKEITIAILPV